MFDFFKKKPTAKEEEEDLAKELNAGGSTRIDVTSGDKQTVADLQASEMKKEEIINQIKLVQKNIDNSLVDNDLDEIIDNVKRSRPTTYSKETQAIDILMKSTLDMIESQNYQLTDVLMNQYVVRLSNLSRERAHPSPIYADKNYLKMDQNLYKAYTSLDTINAKVLNFENEKAKVKAQYKQYLEINPAKANAILAQFENQKRQNEANLLSKSVFEQKIAALEKVLGIYQSNAGIIAMNADVGGDISNILDEINEISGDVNADLKSVQKLTQLADKFADNVKPAQPISAPNFTATFENQEHSKPKTDAEIDALFD